MSTGKESKYLFEDFRIDIDPDKIDESVKALQERLKRMVDQGRYTKVRLKYKGKALMPDIPFGIFMATEAAFVDMSSCISDIVEVHSDVLVNLLVVLAVMFGAVAPSSTLEGLPVVAVLVGVVTLAAIGSCGD